MAAAASAPLGRRAVVVGGSLAGVLCARAVSAHFDEVVLLERAALPAQAVPRRSTPQSFHLHVLLKGGENAMEALAPGFRDAIEAAGSVTIHPGQDMHSASEMGVGRRFETDMRVHGQSRWLLEDCLRRRVVELTENLEVRSGVTVRGLVHDAQRHAVTGVVQEQDGERSGNRSELACELVVDASGRGEGAVRWLTALGLPVPEVEEVKVDFGYASTVLRLADDPERSWKGIVVGNLPRVGARGGVIMPIEPDEQPNNNSSEENFDDPFDALPLCKIRTGVPVIKRAAMAFDCEVVRHFDLEADHGMYIGLVVGVKVFEQTAPPEAPKQYP